MRVSSLPTLHGEKMVLRILDVQSQPLSFEALGMPDKELAQLKQAIQRPHGMVMITGPTGSGKTVTLYTCLNHLNTASVNIATVEDPSEIVLPGANQINVNERIGLSFDVALRALLRQDPDILRWEKFGTLPRQIPLSKRHKPATWFCLLCIQTTPLPH
jgi:type IV pilus assembly protein PilB